MLTLYDYYLTVKQQREGTEVEYIWEDTTGLMNASQAGVFTGHLLPFPDVTVATKSRYFSHKVRQFPSMNVPTETSILSQTMMLPSPWPSGFWAWTQPENEHSAVTRERNRNIQPKQTWSCSKGKRFAETYVANIYSGDWVCSNKVTRVGIKQQRVSTSHSPNTAEGHGADKWHHSIEGPAAARTGLSSQPNPENWHSAPEHTLHPPFILLPPPSTHHPPPSTHHPPPSSLCRLRQRNVFTLTDDEQSHRSDWVLHQKQQPGKTDEANMQSWETSRVLMPRAAFSPSHTRLTAFNMNCVLRSAVLLRPSRLSEASCVSTSTHFHHFPL